MPRTSGHTRHEPEPFQPGIPPGDGMTYRQCLLECRLNAVFYLIKRNRYTIEEAAVVVGYEDGCYLQRAFKNFTGLTPHQFLRRYPRAFMLERFDKARAI